MIETLSRYAKHRFSLSVSRTSPVWSSLLCLFIFSSVLTNTDESLAEPSNRLPESIALNTHDLFPYGSYQPDGSFSGVAYDVVDCALTKLDIDLNLKVVPWRRAQLEVENGDSDGFFAGSQNNHRDSYANKSVIIADQIWQWYLLKDSTWDTSSPEFKIDASVSSFLGANMQTWLVQNQFKVNSEPQDTKDLLDLLLLGRIDAALANNYVMDAIISKRGIGHMIRREQLKSKPLYVYFNKKLSRQHPQFLPAFNLAVQDCQARIPID